MMHKALITGGALAVIFAGSAEARSIPNTGTPQSVQQLIACRSIADSAQRLACYDRQAAVVEKGIATKELVVIDKARATAAKRSLFGFSVPDFGGLFGGGDNDVKELATTITTVSQHPYGRCSGTLSD